MRRQTFLHPDRTTFSVRLRDILSRRLGWIVSVLCICLSLSACGGMPRIEVGLEPIHTLGHDWQKHFNYALQLMEQDRPFTNKNVFIRAAFSSAARFSRDHAPSYAGLGLSEMALGNFAEAQTAFLNAALIDDRSMYWALSIMAALQSGDEIVARTLFDAMQAARIQDDDPASHFIRAVYLAKDTTYDTPVTEVPYPSESDDINENLVCDDASDEDICQNLNIVANIYFVRRYSTDSITRGTDFFNDLTFQLGAQSTRSWEKNWERSWSTGWSQEPGKDADELTEEGRGKNWATNILNEVSLSIPEIQYAVRITPQNVNSSVAVDAAPSLITSVGKESEIREGTNMTILYNSTGDADEYTAKTGLTLHLAPTRATPAYVSLKIDFEFSSISTLEPSGTTQVVGVSQNTYSVEGAFPYGRPVVLGTISTDSQQYNATGQSGLNQLPLIGGAFGKSVDQNAVSDTLVLGVLSVLVAFHGSHERRVLDAMQTMGVQITPHPIIKRRKILYQAPDLAEFLQNFLKEHSPFANRQG